MHSRARLPEMEHRVGLGANSTHQARSQIGCQAMSCLHSQVPLLRRWLGKEESNARAWQAFAGMSDLCLFTMKLQMYFYFEAEFYNPYVLPWVYYTDQ